MPVSVSERGSVVSQANDRRSEQFMGVFQWVVDGVSGKDTANASEDSWSRF